MRGASRMTTLDTLTVADVERQKLQRHFGRYDILFFLICTIVGVDTIATVAQGGGEAFTWMMIFAVVFFVPQALLFAELGSAFPQEGGPYYWTRLAFGHLAGAVNNFLYWITNPVWIGGTLAISCIGAIEVFFNQGNTVPTAVFYVVALTFVGLFTLSVILYAAKHGAHGLGASSYVVVLAQQITSGNAAKYFNAVLGVTISTTLISYLL